MNIVCPNCGMQVPFGSSFCGFCGTRLKVPDDFRNEKKDYRSTNNNSGVPTNRGIKITPAHHTGAKSVGKSKIGLIAAIIICLTLGIWFFKSQTISSSNNSDRPENVSNNELFSSTFSQEDSGDEEVSESAENEDFEPEENENPETEENEQFEEKEIDSDQENHQEPDSPEDDDEGVENAETQRDSGNSEHMYYEEKSRNENDIKEDGTEYGLDFEEYVIPYKTGSSLRNYCVIRNESGYLYGLYDISRGTVIEPKYDFLDIKGNQSAEFCIAKLENEKYGVIDVNEQTVIPFNYNHIKVPDDHRIFAIADGQVDIFDFDGNLVGVLKIDTSCFFNTLERVKADWNKNGFPALYLFLEGNPSDVEHLDGWMIDENGNRILDSDSSLYISKVYYNPAEKKYYALSDCKLYRWEDGSKKKFVKKYDLSFCSSYLNSNYIGVTFAFDRNGHLFMFYADNRKIHLDYQAEKCEDAYFIHKCSDRICYDEVTLDTAYPTDGNEVAYFLYNNKLDTLKNERIGNICLLDDMYAESKSGSNWYCYDLDGKKLSETRYYAAECVLGTGGFIVLKDADGNSALYDSQGEEIDYGYYFDDDYGRLVYKSHDIKHVDKTSANYYFWTGDSLVIRIKR